MSIHIEINDLGKGKWFATFIGRDEKRRNAYVLIPAEEYMEARALMHEKYGAEWGFIYAVEHPAHGLQAQIDAYGLQEIPFGE